jgi:Protein of unknown function (DUF1064)
MRWMPADLAKVAGNLQAHIRTPLKFHNEPVRIAGRYFDSKLEARRWGELELLQKAGSICDLEFHKRWYLHVNGIQIGYYESDATYTEDGQTVIEDSKGVRTAIYRWKKRHVMAQYGIAIREITA